MPFSPGIIKMKGLTTLATDHRKHSNQYNPAPLLPELVLKYPGLIKYGDYRLEFKGTSLTHMDIVDSVHNCTRSGNGKIITNFLVDLYTNGLKANTTHAITIDVNRTSLSLEEFKYLAYWIVLQEDINFPRPRYMGVRMPIIRYIEGAISALHPDLLSLEQVRTRTNIRGVPPKPAFEHPAVTGYLRENILAIR